MYKIPYFYKITSPQFRGYLIHEDVNQGIILCRRLGLEPKTVLLGKDETKQSEFLEPSLEIWGPKFGLNYDIQSTNEESELSFLCEIRDLEKEKQQLQEILNENHE